MPELTKPQQTFISRLAIVTLVGDYRVPPGSLLTGLPIGPLLDGDYDDKLPAVPEAELASLGVAQDYLDGYALAREDLERARLVMEEQAAFGHAMTILEAEHPGTVRAQLQKAARALIADPEVRERYAEDSGLYDRLGFDEEVPA